LPKKITYLDASIDRRAVLLQRF